MIGVDLGLWSVLSRVLHLWFNPLRFMHWIPTFVLPRNVQVQMHDRAWVANCGDRNRAREPEPSMRLAVVEANKKLRMGRSGACRHERRWNLSPFKGMAWVATDRHRRSLHYTEWRYGQGSNKPSAMEKWFARCVSLVSNIRTNRRWWVPLLATVFNISPFS